MASYGSKSGGGGGYDVAYSAAGQGGAHIDLADNPLRYGTRDTAVSGAMRSAIEKQERKRQTAKVEYAYAMDENGNLIGEKRGGRGSCSVPYSFWTENGILTHNHPRTGDEIGILGGTFSVPDIKQVALRGIKTMRASAAEGTYSITKGKNFNGQGLLEYRRKLDRETRKVAKAKVQEAGERYKRGEISYSELQAVAKKASNASLVSIHNGLIAGQKEYGYTYTLERNG